MHQVAKVSELPPEGLGNPFTVYNLTTPVGAIHFLSCGMAVVPSKEVSLFLLLLVLWDFLHSAAGIIFETVRPAASPPLSHPLLCAICPLHPWNTLPPFTVQHVHGGPDQQKRLSLFMLSASFLTGKARTRIFVLFLAVPCEHV